MASDLEIVQWALSELGDKEINSYPNSNNRAAEIAETHFSRSLDETLALNPWNEAMKNVQVATGSSFSGSLEYSQSYAIPSDNIQLYSINEEEYKYTENYDIQGQWILANNADSIYLKYTKRINASEMSTNLAHLFSLVLAKNMCMTLTKNGKLKASIVEMVEKIYLPRYKYKDGRSKHTATKMRKSNWINARYQSPRRGGYYNSY